MHGTSYMLLVVIPALSKGTSSVCTQQTMNVGWRLHFSLKLGAYTTSLGAFIVKKNTALIKQPISIHLKQCKKIILYTKY